MRRFTEPLVIEISCLFNTSLMCASVSRVRFCLPCSIRFTADWLVPRRLANSACVRPRRWRICAIKLPIFSFDAVSIVGLLYHLWYLESNTTMSYKSLEELVKAITLVHLVYHLYASLLQYVHDMSSGG